MNTAVGAQLNESPVQRRPVSFTFPKLLVEGSATSSLLYLFSTMTAMTLNFVTFPLTVTLLMKDIVTSIFGAKYRPRPFKHIVISGGTSGIGIELISSLARPGLVVSLVSHDQLKLEHARDLLVNRYGCRVRIACFDLGSRSPEDLINLETWLKDGHDMVPIDLVIANAGAQTYYADQFTQPWSHPDTYIRMIETNYLGVLKLVFPCINLMKSTGNGGHVAITSSLESFFPFAEHALYASTKAALTSLSESLRVLLLPEDIHITLITPGFIKTQMTRAMKREGGKPEIGWVPSKQAGQVFARAIERGDPWIAFPVSQGVLEVGLSTLNAGLRTWLLFALSKLGLGSAKLS